ncbi:ABC transporter substrate-binding protein [Pollutimonas subterranea]|uniref:ABC transporter substrate-binding protein n=1 Tax=Pollutimonas subterranea TaxID=2045210 RepID=A0A2N4U0E7_9BURK|nr:tripartite tricarboxylate transporter substrate binding protein [Pollutimonas subterranea]PLC48482.1 ABC transporter substrate-binding protein [Pollutimonas subterranea]
MHKVRSLVLLFACLVVSGAVLAQSPSRTFRLVIPFSAGGQLDVMGRIVAVSLGEALQANVVVENLPGAGGVIGARRVLKEPADGLTIFEGTPSQLVLAGMVNKENAIKSTDFVPIHMIGTSPYVIFARSGLQAKNADELATLAKESAKDGVPLSYASVGVGTLNHVLGEELSRRMGAPLLHVPYKGGADVVRDLAGGRVDLFINMYTAQHMSMAESGRFNFITALSPERQDRLPNVPSSDESSSLKGFYASLWTGLFVKAGTPAPILAELNQAMAKVLSDPVVQKTLMEQTATPAAKPAPSVDVVSAEYEKGIQEFSELGKSAGL